MRKLSLLLTLLLMIVTKMQAKEFRFDEMNYTKERTVFQLFAPKDAKKVVWAH